jgi:hypothetical protein
MVDRRLFFVGAIVVALIFLSLIGLPPKVLWQKLQEFTSNATGAAVATRKQSNKREEHHNEVGQVLDGLPNEKKDSWADPKRRNQP